MSNLYAPVYFNYREWKCRCGKCYGDAATKPLTDNLLRYLDILRAAHGGPVIMTSGWRCMDYNALTPGASDRSLHIKGCAADIKAETPDKFDSLVALARRLTAIPGLRPDELILGRGYLHVAFKK
jgi:hypothetical protein